jgi:hypothetical protein
MRSSRHRIVLLAALSLALPALAAAPKPAPAPKPASVVKSRGTTVAAAIAALQKEYQAYAKDPRGNTLRTKSNYFAEHPTAEATPDAIMKALEGSVSGGSDVEAYVKWQLLSAIPGKFAPERLKRGIAVYHRAPMPAEPHPGLDHYRLKRAINGIRKEDVQNVQHQFDQAVKRFKDANEVFISYRDDLFSRLPDSYDAINAGLEDVEERASRGLNANTLFDNVAAAIRSWSITDAKPSEVRAVGQTILNIKAALAREENKPYTKIVDKKGWRWEATGSVVDPKKIDLLVKFLENYASGSNAGGLKFKDSK